MIFEEQTRDVSYRPVATKTKTNISQYS